MKGDINDTLRADGQDGVRARHDNAHRYQRAPRQEHVNRNRGTNHAATRPALSTAPLIVSTADFIGGFEPPDYLIDGLLQRRFLYSMTAPTGAGKTCIALRICAHVAQGLPLAGREITKGKVLFFA